jgi:hypothetical protein
MCHTTGVKIVRNVPYVEIRGKISIPGKNVNVRNVAPYEMKCMIGQKIANNVPIVRPFERISTE